MSTMMWLVALIVFVTAFHYYRRRKLQNLIGNLPIVSNIPFIGTIWQMLDFQPENMHLKFQEYINRFGKSFYAIAFGQVIIVTADPCHASKLLTSQKNLRKNLLYLMLESWLGNGLLLATGSHWQTMRKIITPAFHYNILEQFVDVFDRQSRILIDILKDFADGETVVNIYPHMGLTTLDIIAETAMGVSVNAQLKSNTKIVNAVNDVTRIVAMRFIRPLMAFPFTFKMFAPILFKTQNEGIKTMHEFTEHIIEERRKHILEDNFNSNDLTEKESTIDCFGKKKKMALLDILLQSKIDNEPLTDTQIRDEVNTFMFEGHDTTTSATSFCLYLISRHPQCQQKLYNEIKNHFGSDLSRPITYADLNTLEYLTCVIKESLRLFPPIPAIGRYIEEPMQMDDIHVPAHTNIIILLWSILKDPSVYKDPELFVPERHVNMTSSDNAFSYIPFSAGPRNCIGQRFALLEMKTLIIQILRHYELTPLGEEVIPSIKIVLRSKTGIHMGIKLRKETL